MKKIISLILSLVMVITAVPVFSIAKPVEAKAADYSNGDIIEFGSYPQSEVTDEATLAALNSLTLDWVSYGYMSGSGTSWSDGSAQASDYMQYADVTYNGSKYRAVTFTKYRPHNTNYQATTSTNYTEQSDNGYYINNTYWFKYEPLKWKILDTSTGLVMSESIIDSQAYSDTLYYYSGEYYKDAEHTTYANNYYESTIREWLNDDFYNTAFSSTEKKYINVTELDNSAYSSSYSKYDSETSHDYVFLASYADMLNTDYGFSSDYSDYDEARRAQGTDYAKCQGLWVSTNSSYAGNSVWRLRSAGDYSSDATGVIHYGYVDGSYDVYDTRYGVRPLLELNLISGIFSSYDNDSQGYQIKLYSAMPSLTVGNGQSINCAVQLEYDGSPVNGNDNVDFQFSVSNSNILNISSISKDSSKSENGSNGIRFAITGISPGTTKLTIKEINSGAYYESYIQVVDGILSFAANCMPSYYDSDFEYNGYVSGMYIDDFTYNEESSKLSFNVYNTTSLVGTIDVYDSKRNLINSEMISRFDGNYASSIKDTVVNMYKLIEDGVTGELFTYKQDSYSKETTISDLYVPKGGHIEITNNVEYSQTCALANATELAVESVLTFSNSISDATKIKTVSEKTVKEIIKDSLTKDSFDLGNKLQKKIEEKALTEVSKSTLNSCLTSFVNDTVSVYSAADIDLEKLIIESCTSVGISVAESALTKAMGPAGIVLDGLFLLSDYADLSNFYVSLGKENSSNCLYIYMPTGDNSLCDNGVIITPEDNSNSLVNDNYVIRSVVIEKGEELNPIAWNNLDEISTDYIVREIHLEKDGKEVQPNGSIQVSVPIPDNYRDAKYCYVYWVKDDGTLEKLETPAARNGNYLVFYVDHLSNYAIVLHDKHIFGNNAYCSICGEINQSCAQIKDTVNVSQNSASSTTDVTQTNNTKTDSSIKKPKKTSIKKLKKGKKKITVQWKKVSSISGYQVQAATDKKFKKNKKSVTIKKSKITKTTIKKLKSNKKYYVRIRIYKVVDGKKVYSKWSKVKTVKTK